MVRVFLSHTWRRDALGRDTHERVRRVRDELTAIGVDSWLDEDHMVHDISQCMAHGIDTCAVVVVFITHAYVQKVEYAASHPETRDNCYKEFSYAQATCKRIVPVVFEPHMLDVRNWPNGIVKMHLGSDMYVDGAGDEYDAIAVQVKRWLRKSTARATADGTSRCDALRVPCRPAPVLCRRAKVDDPAGGSTRGV